AWWRADCLRSTPLDEPAHRALMRIYAQQGNTTLALKQYHLCCDALEGDLGVKPEAETQRLYQSIREQRWPGRERRPPCNDKAKRFQSTAGQNCCWNKLVARRLATGT